MLYLGLLFVWNIDRKWCHQRKLAVSRPIVYLEYTENGVTQGSLQYLGLLIVWNIGCKWYHPMMLAVPRPIICWNVKMVLPKDAIYT